MVIWLILFFLVVAVSFVLAWISMADYQEIPANFTTPYSAFLVRRPDLLTKDVLTKLYQATLRDRLIISFERLFRGEKKALVIFGPIVILRQLIGPLSLVEIEEYSTKTDKVAGAPGSNGILAWGVGCRDQTSSDNILQKINGSLFPEDLGLDKTEEFWWQVVVQPNDRGLEIKIADLISRLAAGFREKSTPSKESIDRVSFKGVIRAVLLSGGKDRAQKLQNTFSGIGKPQGLIKLPQLQPTAGFLKSYRDRALWQVGVSGGELKKNVFELSEEGILLLVGLT